MGDTNRELDEIWARSDRIEKVLGTLIRWIVQAAGSPLDMNDAETLLEMLDERIGRGK